MKALVDMDLIVYRIGAACDNWYYEYLGKRYDSQRELKMYLETVCEDDTERGGRLAQAERKRDPEEWSKVKASVIEYTEDILEPYSDYQGYISGKGNFRYSVATILPYKGTRSTVKPTHYDAIRQFLVDVYDAKVSTGMEADDMLGLNQTEDTVIVSLDKDLDMIPGRHYNWVADKEYTIDELEGMRKFYAQMLTGDSTDNILGLYGVGPNSTHVKKLKDMDEESMKKSVIEQYRARFGLYHGQFLQETSKLLWILQKGRSNPFDPTEYWLPEQLNGEIQEEE